MSRGPGRKVAADQGHVTATYNLGCCYRDGQGVDRDDKKAAGLFRKAADKGHASATHNLAWTYETGRGVDKLAPSMRTALANWEKRVPTGQLNQWLTALVQATPHPIRGGRAPRVLFATQAGTAPPKFVLFTTGPLESSYRRFLERRLREAFDFTGSPIRLSVRARERRARRS